ncbi:hypothetical protein BD779DRAFT_1473054 [Infundibulicybe gibba]|nr:hypothetical protein BD779DRAFT_1473054 [Infundibulicybe gibba]
MEESPHRYEFLEEGRERVIAGIVLPRRNLPFQLLEFVNRGRVRGSSSHVYLRRSPIPERTTIADIAAGERREFYCPSAGFGFEGSPARFVIHLVVRHYPITLSLFPLDDPNRRHTCISSKIYSRFRYDGCPVDDGNVSDSSGGVAGEPGLGDLAGENPGGEDLGEEDLGGHPPEASSQARQRLNDPSQSGFQPLQSSSTATVQNPFGSSQPRHTRRTTAGSSQAQRQQSPIHPSITSTRAIPSEIWSEPWEPSNLEPLDDDEQLLPGHVDIGVFDAASAGSPPGEKLSLRGANTIELAEHLCALLAEAGAAGDFTRVLLPEREFFIVYQAPDGLEQIRSLGDGIEREVIYTAFQKYLQSSSQWFLPRAGDFSMVATCHSLATSGYLAPARRQGLLILGALTGLFLIHGMAPAPLSPVLLYYCIHGCDLNAIHERLLGSWYPELRHTIRSWLDAGAGGDTREFQAHFATFHDMQVALLGDRTPASHKAMAGEMLYRAIVGPSESPSHPEIQSFLAGFDLPCRNGFRLSKALCSVSGGTEVFFSTIWRSHISNFSDLEPYLRLEPLPAGSAHTCAQQLQAAGFQLGAEALFIDFLRGSGIPLPSLFEDLCAHFNPQVDLTDIDEVYFRARMFCWAATGSPLAMFGSIHKLSVTFCGDDDDHYALPATRHIMLREGKISFRTCFRQARIPLSYIVHLSRVSSPARSPNQFRTAVDHWLLCETLNAIGSHSIA